jgi:hypothetical protein
MVPAFGCCTVNPIGVFDILGMGALLAYFYHFHIGRLKRILYNIPIITLIVLQFILCLYLIYDPHFLIFIML